MAKIGKANAGSQLQIQTFSNQRSEELSRAVIEGCPNLSAMSPKLKWVSPLEENNFAEYQDTAFLKACGGMGTLF